MIVLFGINSFKNNMYVFFIPLLALLASDLYLNNFVYNQSFGNQFVFFYKGAFFDYLAFVCIILLGKFIANKINPLNITLSAIFGAILFFVVSNFGVWVSTNMYPHTISGLVACYLAGLPFIANTIIGDVFFSTLLFGLFAKKYVVKKSFANAQVVNIH